MFDVAGYKVLITGGTSGIGRATAQRLVKAGAEVVIVGRRDSGEQVASDIGARFVRADVIDEAQLVSAFDQAQAIFGKLDVIFNNAGIVNDGPTIEEADCAEFDRVLEVNVKAAYNVLHHGPARMNDGGSIINTASLAGIYSVPGYGQYGTSKAALVSLSRISAQELGSRKIRVNAICPGAIWSEMLQPDNPEVALVERVAPLERIGEAEEVAALVHFLASNDSRYITGTTIPIDGGISVGLGYPALNRIMGAES